MKIIALRRTVVARCVCPQCHEPARPYPPHRWTPANGPRPAWSHWDGEPLCPVVGANGYRPARRGCVLIALRPVHPNRADRRRSHARRTRRTVTRRTVTRRTVRRSVGAPSGDASPVFMVAGGDMVAVFDNPKAAGIMAVTMTGANLEPEILRLTPAQWAQALAVLRKHFPYVTITDARSGRGAGAP